MILKAYNLSLTKGQPQTRLVADVASGSTSIDVANISELNDGDYLVIGNWGEATAEIKQISGAPSGSSVTLGSSLTYDHFADTPIVVTPYNKVQFFYSSSEVDANNDDSSLSQLNGDIDIQANREYTIYKDTSGSSGYGYIRFTNSSEATYSLYSEHIDYSGRRYDSVGEVLTDAVESLGLNIGDEDCEPDKLFRDINEAQSRVINFADWQFELVKNDTSIATTENENIYSLNDLTYPLKYDKTMQGILNVKLGSNLLEYIDIDEMDEKFENTTKSYLDSDVTAGDSSITLEDTNEFSEEGNIKLGQDTISYTSKDDSIGVLSGCTGVDNDHSSGDTVWQGIDPGIPTKYSIFNENIILNYPVEKSKAGYKLKFKYLKRLSRFTSYGDVIEIPFYSALSSYVKYKIEKRRKNYQEANLYKGEFKEYLELNSNRQITPMLETYKYYNL